MRRRSSGQSALWLASLHQTGNDLQEDLTARGSEPLNRRSFLRVEEGSLSRTLAFACGHGYAQEEYAVQIDRDVSVGHADLRRLLPAAAAAAAAALAEQCVAGIVRVVAAGRPGARCLLVTTALNSSSREHERRRQIGWQLSCMR